MVAGSTPTTAGIGIGGIMPAERGPSGTGHDTASSFEHWGETVTVRRLLSGYYHLRGIGPCNWAQPQHWPEPVADALEEAFFAEAGQAFRAAVVWENERLWEERTRGR